MPKGGARVNSGPPPDPNALRRDRPADRDGWVVLPADGYEGPAPEWPLPANVTLAARRDAALDRAESLADELAAVTDPKDGPRIRRQLEQTNLQVSTLDKEIDAMAEVEASVWVEVWRTPQAAVWARLGWSRDVAQYVRHKVLGELGSLKDAVEARQWSDRLGLNPAGMLRNRWKIGQADATGPRPGATTAAARPAVARTSARDRFKVVRDDDTDVDGDGAG
jgi:hypothetical protein